MTGAPRSPIILAMQQTRQCPVCGEPFGVYEPLLAIGPRSARRISLARQEFPAADETVVHYACATEAAQTSLAAASER